MRIQLLLLSFCLAFVCSCVQTPKDQGGPNDPGRKVKIGFAMDTVIGSVIVTPLTHIAKS
ncbi:MAG: hypothetical protein DMF62_02820 [Acidobacteria bacterium]|nr:MAG: hypothetical protein DMF62_02820 [Acidobacteriota bacterium]